ncbi:cupin domain-containing protein [Streptosporangium algeriense]|uniref:Cupin domain-containing protein n=1 Tax=Streptosporangium algeriense TaxID=1682748 RepID=A0ABW3DLY4_9ACTN
MTETASPEITAQQRGALVLRNLLSAGFGDTLKWATWSEPGRAGVELHTLYTTDAPQQAAAYLIRYTPGAHGDRHEHLGYEMIFVLDGELVINDTERYGRGDLIIEPPGSVHQVTSETGFLVLAVREAPTAPRPTG